MNISQHAIIPITYPVKHLYYNSNGSSASSDNYRCNDKFSLVGCNRVYRTFPFSAYGYVRAFDSAFGGEVLPSSISLNVNQSVFSLNDGLANVVYFVALSSAYLSYINYPSLIFFKDNSPAVTSLSLRNSLTPDIIDEDILL